MTMNKTQLLSTTSIFQSDVWLFSIYIIGTFEFVFWLCNSFLIFIEMYDFPSIDKYRIQKSKKKLRFQPDIIQLMIKETVRHQASIIILIPLLYYVLNYFGHLDMHGPRPSWLTIIYQLILFILSEDAIFFWTHYLFHTPWLYKTIHKKHHVYKQPTGVVSVLSDPFEGLQNQLSVWFMPVLLKEKHIFTLCIWIAIRVYQTVNAHSGYNLPYVSTQYWFPWIMSGALAHDFHHQHGKWNYGSFFNIWDRLMGTHRLATSTKQTD
jgi:sterol desaturase/sphingolipid hydroxylase (fatty acid hydroxylase superfamily)